ncbi:hypothetical protein ABT095_33885 [Kitasatospora sp. NPDC002227]|uniref:hypothetical protein n=1 Tax=Kitasatospora sp. NPDC002227 TaxID=3154773 RepID=UPI0033339014
MSEPDKNAPLPTMSQHDAQTWAQHMTEYMAQTGGLQLSPAETRANFNQCVGKHDELTTDGRFTLMYSAYADVPRDQQPAVARKIRDMLKGQEFTISSYREYVDGESEVLMYANHSKSHYLITVGRAGRNGSAERVMFAVDTPCLMPPNSSPAQSG